MSEDSQGVGPKIKQAGQEAVSKVREAAADPMTRRRFLKSLIPVGLGVGAVASGMASGGREGAMQGSQVTLGGGTGAEPTPLPTAAPALERTTGNVQLAPKSDLKPQPVPKEVKTEVLPPKDTSERHRFGKLKIPETPEGIPIDFTFEFIDTKTNQPVDSKNMPDGSTVQVHLEHVRQYLDKNHGGIGLKQYRYDADPVGNSTMLTGSPDQPFNREFVFRGHSGVDNGKRLSLENVRRANYLKKDEAGNVVERTPEEAKDFRDNTKIGVTMKWTDEKGQLQEQKADATMHWIGIDNMTAFWKQFAEHHNNDIPKGERPPKPRLSDFVTEEERRGIPQEFHPWDEHAMLYYCGEFVDKPEDARLSKNEGLFLHMKLTDKKL